MKTCASSSACEAFDDAPGAGVEHAALLGEGRAYGLALGRREAGDVVVVLAHRDLAGLQRLLELALVAVPERHVRLDLGELVEHLEDALLGVEHLGAAEPGLGGDLEQERVAGQGEQPELVLVGRIPERLPRGRRLRIDVGVGDQRDVPGHRPDRADPPVRVALDEMRLEVLGVGQLASSSGAHSSAFWPLMRVTCAIIDTSAGAMPARAAVCSWTSQASPVGSAIDSISIPVSSVNAG